MRAIALLQLAKGVSAPRTAAMVPMTPQAIRKVGHRYEQGGMERALYEKGRPGAAALLENSQKQRIIAMVCSDPPEGFARWTVRLVAEEAADDWSHEWDERPSGFCSSATTSNRGGKKMWCVAELNEEYVAKMEDVLETYERPYNPAEPVVCLDEKPITLHADVRPTSPARPGREARRDNEWERCGTANVFCAVEPKAGRHFTFPTPDRSAVEFAHAVFEVAMQYPQADTIHLVVDNLNIHCRKSLTDLLGDDRRRGLGSLHYPPHPETR